jgi:hypothetical protein
MIRSEHVAAIWFAAAMMTGCSRGGPGASGDGSRPVAASPPAAAAAAVPNHVLDPARWADPRVRLAYAAAKRYAGVLEQLYCYCHCKENLGHRALVECFESDHASTCDICMAEAMTAARMTEQGRSAGDIQKAIDSNYKG